MRILHIGKFFPPDIGGMESFLYVLSQEQANNGHAVTVLACKSKASISNIEMQNLSVKRYGIQKYVGGYAPFSLGLLFAILQHCYFKKSPHIIHVHAPNIAALWVALFCKQPIILHWHSDVIFPDKINKKLLFCWRFLERIILKRAKKIIVTSQNYLMSSIFLQDFKNKCTVIPLALPNDTNLQSDMNAPALKFMQHTHDSKKINLLAVGRLTHYKGFSILLEALQFIPNANLCLVGDGELYKDLEHLIDKYDLKKRVLLTGSISNSDLQACYNICDIFILPSILRSEAFGMVLLEAMRAGKACIATAVHGSGMSEVVQDGVTGYIVPPENAKELANITNNLITNNELRKSMGEKGRISWEIKYSLKNIVQQIEEVYKAQKKEF